MNKYRSIFWSYVFVLGITKLPDFFKLIIDKKLPTVLNLIILLLIYFSLAYIFAVPLFFATALQKNSLTYKDIFNKTLITSKRLILPLIFLFVLLLTIFICIALLGVTQKIVIPNISSVQWYLWFRPLREPPGIIIFTIVVAMVTQLFAYWGIFFAVENKSIFGSIIASIKTIVHHWPFIFTVFPFYLIIQTIGHLQSIYISQVPSVFYQVGDILINLVIYYIIFSFTAARLLYYRDHIRKIN